MISVNNVFVYSTIQDRIRACNQLFSLSLRCNVDLRVFPVLELFELPAFLPILTFYYIETRSKIPTHNSLLEKKLNIYRSALRAEKKEKTDGSVRSVVHK